MSIDRRFYRSRYDAERTVEAFTRRIGDEVGFEAVAAAFVDVVGQTVRPQEATLWIRGRWRAGRGGDRVAAVHAPQVAVRATGARSP